MLHETTEERVASGDRILYLYYNFETNQNTRHSDRAMLHVPNIVGAQQFGSK